MPERTLTVRIIGDDKSLDQAFKRSAKSGQQFQVGVKGIGNEVARGLIPASIAVIATQKALSVLGTTLKASVNEARDLSEEVNKNKVIFKDSAAGVEEWAKGLAASFGLSDVEALRATGTIGNLLHTVGLAPAQASEMSKSLVELSADLASFNNATPEDTLAAIQSGLIGQARPLRRYGVLVDAATVANRAMADTGKKSASELTNQEKILARYELILAQTTTAQGDFARTSGGLANQQRILTANVKNLEAEVGAGLLPAILHLTIAANDAFIALDKLKGIKLFGGVDVGKVLGLAGWTEFNFLVDQVHKGLVHVDEDLAGIDVKALQPGQLPGLNVLPGFPVLPTTPTPAKKPAGPPDPFAELKAADARRRKQALAASRDHARAQRDFDAFVSGMGLKLDNAKITATTADDLVVLRQLEAAIVKRIAAEGRTFKLAQQLTDVRGQIASTLADQADAAKQASQDAFDKVIDSLDLNLEIAQTTRGFADDLRALRALEAQILKRIAAEGRTTDLLRQLFENRQAQAQAIADQTKAAQFEALGLTAEGQKRTPGRGALLRRAQSLREQIKGTVLDTPKTRAELARIVAVLKNTTKKAGRDVRAAILQMLNDITNALEGGSSKQSGPMTRFAKRGVEGLVKGLGLTEEQVKEIRQRFSRFNRFDAPGGGTGPRPPGRTVTPTAEEIARHRGDRDVTVNVYIDGSKVEPVVTRRQQKRNGRNAPQRRGVRPGK